jgi:NAD-dependent SIR2 family protein deacetylase
MYNLFNLYDCPKCGEILSDEMTIVEDIDCDNDEIYEVPYCNKCNSEVRQKFHKNDDGEYIPVMEQVSEDRAKWAMGFFDNL